MERTGTGYLVTHTPTHTHWLFPRLYIERAYHLYLYMYLILSTMYLDVIENKES